MKHLLALRPVFICIDILLMLIGCIGFYIVPAGFDPWVGWTCLIIFYTLSATLLSFPAGLTARLPVLLTTELAFTLFFFILFFLPYQQDLLGILDFAASTRLSYTYPRQANAALIIATLSYSAFHLGALLNRAKPAQGLPTPKESLGSYVIIDMILPLLLIFGCVGYKFAGFQPADTSRYSGQSAGTEAGSVVADGLYTVILTLCLLVITRFIVVRARGSRGAPMLWLGMLAVIVWSLQILIAGDRNNFLIVALAGFGGMASLLVRVRLPMVLMSIVLAFSVYNAIEVIRMAPAEDVTSVLTTLENSSAKQDERESSFNTTTITLRAALEIVPATIGFAKGSFFANGVLGIVPLVRGYINPDPRFNTTSSLITYYTIGPYAGWSVGTNVISDTYINFGLAGVVICSLGIGLLIGTTRKAVQRHGLGTRTAFLFIGTIGLIGEMPRYTLDSPIRIVVWGYAILFVLEATVGLHRRTQAMTDNHATSR
ncbi:O-antigen polysaccharide polymerase Wzy [Sphingomonas desiccabilis]|uniref:O-antigen polysaccharide polymerase Wzy n=1 Tax=Sphingomonas desiccabilis TaxID=429134 RepID=A0A4Q2IZG9_9SPHN|nr:O-antigen polysaccharide polymerase Wzy [Sphingomonas desiccabilis]MBB3912710.1 hypothetical protein [Sphingomonas desiccabilis]RXZ34674.1 O-antigen polysaccharide polymerase Wzy [Sphingomonas desiccabilis]